jgi:PhnB protein
MTKTIPYLLVKNGKESIELYKDLFGANQLVHMPFEKEMGKNMGFPDDYDYENSTMHAEIEIGGAKVMLSENIMGRKGSGNVMIYLELDSKEEIDEIYEKIKKKEFQIMMDLEKTFWGSWYMMFEDSNGVGWQLGYSEGEVFPQT